MTRVRHLMMWLAAFCVVEAWLASWAWNSSWADPSFAILFAVAAAFLLAEIGGLAHLASWRFAELVPVRGSSRNGPTPTAIAWRVFAAAAAATGCDVVFALGFAGGNQIAMLMSWLLGLLGGAAATIFGAWAFVQATSWETPRTPFARAHSPIDARAEISSPFAPEDELTEMPTGRAVAELARIGVAGCLLPLGAVGFRLLLFVVIPLAGA